MEIPGIEVGPLDHIGIAVHDIDASIERYVGVFGARRGHRQMVPGQPVEVAFLEFGGDTRIELVQPHDPASPIARFLEERGEALHHLCFRVADIEAALDAARRAGLELIDEVPREGAAGSRIAFLHPRAMQGTLVELKQPAREGSY